MPIRARMLWLDKHGRPCTPPETKESRERNSKFERLECIYSILLVNNIICMAWGCVGMFPTSFPLGVRGRNSEVTQIHVQYFQKENTTDKVLDLIHIHPFLHLSLLSCPPLLLQSLDQQIHSVQQILILLHLSLHFRPSRFFRISHLGQQQYKLLMHCRAHFNKFTKSLECRHGFWGSRDSFINGGRDA